MNEINYSDKDSTKVINLFGICNLLEILRYMILDQNVIVFSKNLTELVQFINGIISFMSPLEYVNIVSVITHEFIKERNSYLESIVPLILGINTTYDKMIFSGLEIKKIRRYLIVDIDKKKIFKDSLNKDGKDDDNELPNFPEKYIKNNFASFFKKCEKLKKGNNLDYCKEIRLVFYGFFASLLSGIDSFIHKEKFKEKEIYINSIKGIPKIFDVDGFIKSHDVEYISFYKFFVKLLRLMIFYVKKNYQKMWKIN